MPKITYLTAETDEGRAAIEVVMARSYHADISHIPAQWAMARLVDDEPVAFALVYPKYPVELIHGYMPLAFLGDIATREDRRRGGHMSGMMQEVSQRLVAAGIPALLLHGDEGLYRRFGFVTYTHHSGIFLTPAQIAHEVGIQDEADLKGFRMITEGVLPDLLVAQYPGCRDLDEAVAVLQILAGQALALGKARILLEEPPPTRFIIRYYRTIETPLVHVARMCGGEHIVAGSDPVGRRLAHADWIRILDAPRMVEQFLAINGAPKRASGELTMRTEAGAFTIVAENGVAHVTPAPSMRHALPWPAQALAQLLMGYQTATFLGGYYDVPLPKEAAVLLDALFPRRWRFSRNESWIYPQ